MLNFDASKMANDNIAALCALLRDFDDDIADRDLLDAALKRLQPEQRAVVVMHYYLGMPLPDVASALGIPIGTAKSRHHRSLQAMRLTIDNDLEPPRPPVAGEQYA